MDKHIHKHEMEELPKTLRRSLVAVATCEVVGVGTGRWTAFFHLSIRLSQGGTEQNTCVLKFIHAILHAIVQCPTSADLSTKLLLKKLSESCTCSLVPQHRPPPGLTQVSRNKTKVLARPILRQQPLQKRRTYQMDHVPETIRARHNKNKTWNHILPLGPASSRQSSPIKRTRGNAHQVAQKCNPAGRTTLPLHAQYSTTAQSNFQCPVSELQSTSVRIEIPPMNHCLC